MSGRALAGEAPRLPQACSRRSLSSLRPCGSPGPPPRRAARLRSSSRAHPRRRGGARRRRRQPAPRRRRAAGGPARRPAAGSPPRARHRGRRARRAQRHGARRRARRLRHTAAEAVAAHAPLELAAFAVAGGAYLSARRRPLDGRQLIAAAAASSLLLAAAAVVETYVQIGGRPVTARLTFWQRSCVLTLVVAGAAGPARLRLPRHARRRADRARVPGRRAERHLAARPKPQTQRGRLDLPGDLAGRIAGPARAAALVLLAAAALVAVSRLAHRRRRARELATFELRLGRDDLSNPYRVQEAFEAIVGALSARWYERLWRGQDHFALETHRLPDRSIRFTLAAPARSSPRSPGRSRTSTPTCG